MAPRSVRTAQTGKQQEMLYPERHRLIIEKATG
jgi:hypothetical protein